MQRYQKGFINLQGFIEKLSRGMSLGFSKNERIKICVDGNLTEIVTDEIMTEFIGTDGPVVFRFSNCRY